MAPTTRRSTRASTIASKSPRKSPSKNKSPSPRKPAKGRSRKDKKQPRVDESLSTAKSDFQRGNGGRKKIWSQEEGLDNEIQMKVQVSSRSSIHKLPTCKKVENPTPSSPVLALDKRFESSPTPTTSSRAYDSDSSTPPSGLSYSSKFESLYLTSQSPSTSVGSPSKISSNIDMEKERELQILKDFDLEGFYGACRGITRRERLERALRYDLKPIPSPHVLRILDKHMNEENYYMEWETCYWDQYDLKLRNRQ